MTWSAAKSFCENDGAALASLRNEWAISYSHMMSLDLNAPLWIGLNRKVVWRRDPLITQSSITVNISSLSDKIGEAEFTFADFAFRPVDISDLLTDSVSPQLPGQPPNQGPIIIVCTLPRMGDGGPTTVIRRRPAFV